MPGQSTPEPAPQSFAERLRTQANAMAFVAGAFAAFAEILMFRKHFGARYFQGWKTGAALLLIPFFSLFWPQHDLRPLFFIWLLFIVRCAMHRVSMLCRRWRESRGMRSRPVHSRYNGEPVLLRRFPKWSETTIKRMVEPLVMLALGIGSLTFSPPLGWFFVWCAVGMGIHTGLLHRHDVQQARDLADAAIDSEILAARVREIRGDVVCVYIGVDHARQQQARPTHPENRRRACASDGETRT